MLRTSLERLKNDIENLSAFTSTPNLGVTRLSFTREDRKARKYIKKQMIDAGLKVWEDGVGTVIGRREGTDPGKPVVMIGSHFDTVKNGGAFDGTAGIVAALEVARVLNYENIKNENPIEVVAMLEEEGTRFGIAMLSSRAMAGKISDEELDAFKDENGITVRKAMEQFGIKPDLIRARRSKNTIKAFVELHIEQGPVLESKNIDIGIVESIVGLGEYKVTIKGKSGHAGTTPMQLRSDALLAASHAIIAVNTAANKVGGGTVATVGKIKVLPGSANVIPNFVEFSIDIRSSKEENIKQVVEDVISVLRWAEKNLGITFRIKRIFYNEPVLLSKKIADLIEKESQNLGFSTLRMNSGAGHDAMVMANIAETGMIFVPSKGGLSHRPDEWTDFCQLQKGVEVLLNVVLNLSKN